MTSNTDVSLAQLSHVLRGPLAAVSTLSILPEVVPDTSLIEQVTRMNTMLSQATLLEVLQSEEPQLNDIVYIADCIQSVFAEVAEMAASKSIELVATTSDFRLRGNEALLERMLLELVVNAIQASPSETTVRVLAYTHAEGFRLQVADSGRGIADFTAAQLPFIRSTDSDGAGLGLPLARAIAEQHGAVLQHQFDDQQGSSVVINLSKSRVI